jgi:putative two-component system response regulator
MTGLQGGQAVDKAQAEEPDPALQSGMVREQAADEAQAEEQSGRLAEKKVIFLVDDETTYLQSGKNVLGGKYSVYTMSSAEKLFDLAKAYNPALILLDVDMPHLSGYEAIKILKSDPCLRKIPVIFLTGMATTDDEITGLSHGAVDYITKPWRPALLAKRVEVHLLLEEQRQTLREQGRQLQDFNQNLQQLVEQKTETVLELQNAILKTMAELIECRDTVTGRHIERTQRGVSILLRALRETGVYAEDTHDWDSELLLQSSQLHDVGKIAITDALLRKPGRLSESETREMRRHTTFGVSIIEKIEANTKENDFLKYAKIFAGTHHERWDGSGYPAGLGGMWIPLPGRILAIADVYDALIGERPYKPPLPHEKALQIIEESTGSHFDPTLVEVFLKVEHEFRDMCA